MAGTGTDGRSVEDVVGASTDPRLYAEATRVVDGASGVAVLVGVVHDHPASVYRARRVVESVAPDAVAVELPELAVPAFERLPAADGSTNTTDDGTPDNEMSAALAAADGARTVGIDGVDGGLARDLVGSLWREDASVRTVRRVGASLVGVTREALACGVAGRRDGPLDPDRLPRGGTDYGATAADPPDVQVADERRHRSRSRSLLRAIERPHADRILDGTRERAMVRRLATLADDGDVVAVVGFEHLETVADGLEAEVGTP
jgi:hypothetical protein